MGARFIVFLEPPVHILLEFLYGTVNLLPEGHRIKFILDSAVKPLTDAVALWRMGLGLGVVNVLNGQVELILMMLPFAAIFGAAVGKDAEEPDSLLFIPGDHPVIEQIRSH